MCKIKLVFVMIPTAINQGKQLIETTRTSFFLYEFLVKTAAEEIYASTLAHSPGGLKYGRSLCAGCQRCVYTLQGVCGKTG